MQRLARDSPLAAVCSELRAPWQRGRPCNINTERWYHSDQFPTTQMCRTFCSPSTSPSPHISLGRLLYPVPLHVADQHPAPPTLLGSHVADHSAPSHSHISLCNPYLPSLLPQTPPHPLPHFSLHVSLLFLAPWHHHLLKLCLLICP